VYNNIQTEIDKNTKTKYIDKSAHRKNKVKIEKRKMKKILTETANAESTRTSSLTDSTSVIALETKKLKLICYKETIKYFCKKSMQKKIR
jgi:hypothetical protein